MKEIRAALGFIETVSLTAAVAAADAALKSADVRLVGRENSKGGGMITVKISGDVGAVKAALAAASAEAGRVNRVVSAHVIPRPASGLGPVMVWNGDTLGVSTWIEASPDEEAPAVAEEVVVGEAPAVAEEAVVEEAPAVAEEAVDEEAPAVAEEAVVEEAPAVAEEAVVEETSAVAEKLVVAEAERPGLSERPSPSKGTTPRGTPSPASKKADPDATPRREASRRKSSRPKPPSREPKGRN